MSKEHANPHYTIAVLRRLVEELRKAGAETIPLAELERALDNWGTKK